MQRGAHDAAVMQHFVAQNVETLSPTCLKFILKSFCLFVCLMYGFAACMIQQCIGSCAPLLQQRNLGGVKNVSLDATHTVCHSIRGALIGLCS